MKKRKKNRGNDLYLICGTLTPNGQKRSAHTKLRCATIDRKPSDQMEHIDNTKGKRPFIEPLFLSSYCNNFFFLLSFGFG